MAAPPRRLVIVRHAKSDWSDGGPDADRPLAERGRRDAPAIGRWLVDRADLVGPIDLVLCSPAVRARQTWELAAAQLEPAPPVRDDERLYDASATDLLAIVRELPADVDTAAVVGHNPALTDLVRLLSGEPVELKTAAVAVLRWPGSWADAAPRVAELAVRAKPRG
jgi:phosphohistidine phosphatase